MKKYTVYWIDNAGEWHVVRTDYLFLARFERDFRKLLGHVAWIQDKESNKVD